MQQNRLQLKQKLDTTNAIEEPTSLPTSLTTDLEALSYIASHADLIRAFGTNIKAAKSHYVNHGRSKGRTITFDAEQYISNYADLTRVFGSDYVRATKTFYKSWS